MNFSNKFTTLIFSWPRLNLPLAILCFIWMLLIGVLQQTVQQVNIPLQGEVIQHETGCAYTIQINRRPFAWPIIELIGDSLSSPNVSSLVLLEDGQSIGNPHALHSLIRNNGTGNYSHWGDTLYFSTPDCTDPRYNGKKYEVSILPSLTAWAKVAWLIAAFIVCILIQRYLNVRQTLNNIRRSFNTCLTAFELIRHLSIKCRNVQLKLRNTIESQKTVLEWSYLLLLPIILYFLLQVSPINQLDGLNNIDPWFYVGARLNLNDWIARYGLDYYMVRFGLIVPGYYATKLFGLTAGYYLTVYGEYLLAGIPLYFVMRKYFSKHAAITAYFLIISSLWIARSLLWTYTDSLSVPYMMAATSLLFYRSRNYQALSFFLIGVLAGLAANSHAFTITVSGLLVAPYFILYRGGKRYHLKNLGMVCIGFLSTYVIGAFFYGTVDIITPTFNMIRWGIGAGSDIYKPLATEDIIRIPYVYQPLLYLGALLMVRRAITAKAKHFVEAAAAYLGVICVFVVIYQFILNKYLLEWVFYFAYLAPPAIYCAVLTCAVVIDGSPADVDRKKWAAVIIISAPFIALLLHSYHWINLGSLWQGERSLRIWLTVSLLLLILTGIFVKRRASIALLALFLVANVWGWRQLGGSHFYNTIGSSEGLASYRLVAALIEEMPKFREDGRALLFWNLSPPGRNRYFMDSSIAAFGWNPARFSPDNFDATKLRDAEVRQLMDASPLWLVLLSGDSFHEYSAAQASLMKKGMQVELQKSKSLCDDDRCIHFELLGITPSPVDVFKDGIKQN